MAPKSYELKQLQISYLLNTNPNSKDPGGPS